MFRTTFISRRAIASFDTPSPKTTEKSVGNFLWLIKVRGAIVSVAIRVTDKHIVVVMSQLCQANNTCYRDLCLRL